MEIIVGRLVGFCSGVQRAISGSKKALRKNRKIYCLGEIIHNRVVVDELKQKGMVVVKSVTQVPDSSNFIIRSHGLPNNIIQKASEKHCRIYDFTCPKVKNTHRLVIDLTADGYQIVIIGNPEHPEIKAIFSLTEGNARVIENSDDIKALNLSEKNAIVVQTTFSPQAFSELAGQIILQSKKTSVYNTLCEETIKRQKEAVHLSEKVDFMIVVGGKNSSNTKTLCNIAKIRVPVTHIEESNELDKVNFKNIQKVGIISGASTPKEQVNEVYLKLLNL